MSGIKLVDNRSEDAFESLVVGITGDAEIFGYKPSTLALSLVDVAEKYRAAMVLHNESVTRGELLNQLIGLDIDDHDTFSKSVGNLSVQARDAILGETPYPKLQLRGITAESDTYDVYVAGSEEREVFAIKKMLANHARSNIPTMIGAKRDRTGFESLFGQNWKKVSSYLLSAFERQPVLFKMALRNVVGKIRRTFQLEDNKAGGLNQKVIAGIAEPLDWQLVNNILDVIWPLEKGPMHSSRMSPARQIIDQVIIFSLGERQALSRRKKLMRPGRKPKNTNKEDKGHLFSEYVFSTALTYRHQFNTLNNSIQYVQKRMDPLLDNKNRSPAEVNRLNLIDIGIYFPLKYWKDEIYRRLSEGDYRPGDEDVRRVTGAYLGFPEVPMVTGGLPQPETTVRLIKALRNYKSKKTPLNKGIPESPPKRSNALSAEFIGPPTLAQLKKRNKIMMDRRKKGR